MPDYPYCAFCEVPTAEHPEPLCSPGVVRDLRAEVERLRKELAETRTEKVVALLERIGDWDEIGEYVRKIEAERDALKAAARNALEIYQTHRLTAHPDRLHDPACAGCRMGVALSRGLPRKVDSREEIERILGRPTDTPPRRLTEQDGGPPNDAVMPTDPPEYMRGI